MLAVDHCDARRVVPAILKLSQAVNYQRHNFFVPNISDNSAHRSCSQPAEPFFSFFSLFFNDLAGTPTTKSPASISLVTTLPAPVDAPSPTVIGATSIVSEPILTLSPMWVSCLFLPS